MKNEACKKNLGGIFSVFQKWIPSKIIGRQEGAFIRKNSWCKVSSENSLIRSMTLFIYNILIKLLCSSELTEIYKREVLKIESSKYVKVFAIQISPLQFK